MTETAGTAEPASPSSALLTFLIADVRGYTQFTAEYGDEAAAHLAGRFAEVAEEVVAAHEGEVLELRGDEALCVFSSARSALQAAISLQAAFHDATAADPSLPLTVGMGLDAGEPIRVRGGYRGGALNLAARLCSLAAAGEVLCSETLIGLARKTDRLVYLERGEVQLKGLLAPVRVIQVVPEDAVPAEVSTFTVHAAPPSNLPIQPTPFIGRAREVTEISGVLRREQVRLLTLTGPGGTGKTRLALQVADDLLSTFADGVFLVSLAPLTDPASVTSAIATVLGIKESSEQPLTKTLGEWLRDRQILLVLDNFEHLLAAAPVVSDLLRCPQLNVLVTSRAPLHLAAEHEYPVSPLALPRPDQTHDLETVSRYDAVALFVERARAVKPAFALTEESATAVVEICAHLDGLPLAIELAAARIRLFPPHTLLQRLSSRLRLLTGGAKDAPARQQTLRSTIDWSYGLLSKEERVLFARLSVFADGGTYEAIEVVCNPESDLDLVDALSSLVEKSLLRQASLQGRELDEPRFIMLETIREYALDRLATSGEEQDIRHAHAVFFTEMAEAGYPQFWTLEQKAWLDQLEIEHDNIREALDWSIRNGEQILGLRLACAVGLFWEDRGHLSESRRWWDLVLAGDAGAGTSLRAKALDSAGMHARIRGEYPEAHRLLEEALGQYRQLDDQQGEAMTLAHLGGVARLQGDLDRAAELLEASIQMHREVVDDARFLASALTNLGEVQMRQGDYRRARALLDEALAIRRESADTAAVGQTLTAIGRVELLRGDVDRAAAIYREAVYVLHAVLSLPNLVGAVEGLAETSAEQSDRLREGRLRGAAASLRKTIGLTVPSALDVYNQDGARASGSIDEAHWIAAWNDGVAMSLDAAVQYALRTDT